MLHVLQKKRNSSDRCLLQGTGFSIFTSSLALCSSPRVSTRWPSKQCMNWCAITQFAQRKLAQSKQRPIALSSLLLQPVQLTHGLSRAVDSRILLTAKSGNSPATPLAVKKDSWLQSGHVILSWSAIYKHKCSINFWHFAIILYRCVHFLRLSVFVVSCHFLCVSLFFPSENFFSNFEPNSFTKQTLFLFFRQTFLFIFQRD